MTGSELAFGVVRTCCSVELVVATSGAPDAPAGVAGVVATTATGGDVVAVAAVSIAPAAVAVEGFVRAGGGRAVGTTPKAGFKKGNLRLRKGTTVPSLQQQQLGMALSFLVANCSLLTDVVWPRIAD